MSKNFSPGIYVEITNKDTSEILDITKKSEIKLYEYDVLELSGMTKKQLDLYLFRNKEIEVSKIGNKKFISVNILLHVQKNFKRMQKKYNLN